MYVYLIGCLTYYFRNNQLEKGYKWRLEFSTWANDNGIKVFNPALNFQKEVNHTYNPRLCVDQNEYYISKCDIAVVNMNDILQSPGSIYELVRFKTLNKPVIAFGERSWSPHLNSCISHQCGTLEEVKEVICNMFL